MMIFIQRRVVLALTLILLNTVIFGQNLTPLDKESSSRRSSGITAILGAFPAEVEILQGQVQQKKETIIQSVHFTEGILNGRRIVLAQTGIGKVNAASTTALLLDHFHPEQVLFTGIAGGVNPKLKPGDIVIGIRIAHHDYGTITPDSLQRRPTRNPFTLEDNPQYFISDTTLVRIAEAASKKTVYEKSRPTPTIIKGTIVTGDVFVASGKATTSLQQQMNADATEMEGAAVAQICWQQRVPFLVIRSLSDNANSSAGTDVKTFYEIAARNSASLVMAITGALVFK
jgi:adenosylhomocysteine nucleosidase